MSFLAGKKNNVLIRQRFFLLFNIAVLGGWEIDKPLLEQR